MCCLLTFALPTSPPPRLVPHLLLVLVSSFKREGWATGQRLTKGGVVCSCAGGSVWHQHGWMFWYWLPTQKPLPAIVILWIFPFGLPQSKPSLLPSQTGLPLFLTASRFVSELPSMALCLTASVTCINLGFLQAIISHEWYRCGQGAHFSKVFHICYLIWAYALSEN